MARNPRAPTLETRTARLKLKPRKKPYVGAKLARGIQLRYRRNKGAGTWDVKVADGHGGFWTKGFAVADDYEAADGERVLDWFQAIAAARKFARGQTDSGRPGTVADAVDAFERDLKARGASVANAGRIRKHLTATLASKPVGLLTARELAAWRDGQPPSYAARFVGVNDNRKEFTTYCIIPRPDRPMREEAMRTTTTREMRTNEVYRAAVIFGIISDYSPESIFKVEKILKEQLAAGKIVKRKDGASRTSPAWYAAKIPNDPRWSRHD
jgi:hypothetical protein